MQAIVNATFGAALRPGPAGLSASSTPLLWGFLGAMLRYLPYIGPYLAVTFPISLTLAMSQGWGPTLEVIGAVPDARADHLQLHRAAALRPEHGGLRDRAAGLGGVLGVPLGTDRAGALQPADGLPGGAGPLHPAARVPLRPAGRRAGPGRRHQLLPAAAGPRPGRGRGPGHRADEGGGVARADLRRRCCCRRLSAIKRNRISGDITEEDEQYALQAIREIVEDIGEGRIGAAADGRPAGQPEPAAEATPARPSPRDPDLRLPGPRRRGPRGAWRCSSRSSTRRDGTSS